MLDNARRGRCREVRVGMEIDEKRRVGCNERVLPRRSLVRVRECCILVVRAPRERGGKRERKRGRRRGLEGGSRVRSLTRAAYVMLVF